MKYINNLSEKEFDLFAKNHEQNSIFQTSAWANTKDNWQVIYVGVEKEKEIIAGAMILLRSLPMGLYFAYIPRGPIMDYTNEQVLSFFFKNLGNHFKQIKAYLCKFDPNIIISRLDFEDKKQLPLIKDQDFVQSLKKYQIRHCGYNLSIKDSIQPRIQLAIDTDDYENIIPNKTMKKVRRSIKKGAVVCNEGSNVDSLVAMVNYTKQRHNISLRNRDYFEKMVTYFKDDACVLSAYVGDVLISSALIVKSKTTAEILYSGYHDDYKAYNSTYLLRYEAIKYAQESGCKYFNFGGVEGTLDDGLTEFKSSFRPKIDIFIGEFNFYPSFVISRILSFLWRFKSKVIK